MPPESKKLLDQVRETIRLKHYSRKTEKNLCLVDTAFHSLSRKETPPADGEREIEAFLSHLAVDRNVAASTQNQAFNAILFLYRAILGKKLDDSIDAIRAKRPRRLPTVLSRQEAHQVIDAMSGTPLPKSISSLVSRSPMSTSSSGF